MCTGRTACLVGLAVFLAVPASNLTSARWALAVLHLISHLIPVQLFLVGLGVVSAVPASNLKFVLFFLVVMGACSSSCIPADICTVRSGGPGGALFILDPFLSLYGSF